MHMTASGRDDLARFEVHIPGKCDVCEATVEVAIKYHSSILIELKKRGLGKNPSLILERPWGIGVTCGCYARFQRQIAHISKRRDRKDQS